MAYGATGINRENREMQVAVMTIASDITVTTAAGSTTVQTATASDGFAKITTLAAAAQVPDATLTLTVTNTLATVNDMAFISIGLVSGTAAGILVQSVLVTASTITIVIANSGTANWATPVFLVNVMLVKALPVGAAN